MSNRKKFKVQKPIRLTESDERFLNELSAELDISFSGAVRQCINFTFVVAPVLKEITMWDAIANMSPVFLEEMSKSKFGGIITNGIKSAAETNKKI